MLILKLLKPVEANFDPKFVILDASTIRKPYFKIILCFLIKILLAIKNSLYFFFRKFPGAFGKT